MFATGALVLKKDFTRKKRAGGKLDHRWTGPYKMVSALGAGLYRLQDAHNPTKVVTRVNGVHLKKYLPQEVFIYQYRHYSIRLCIGSSCITLYMYVSGYACVNDHILQLVYDVNNTISSDYDASANSVAHDIVSGSSWDQGIASANNTPPTLHVPNPPLPSSQHSLSPHSSTDHCKDNIIYVDSCMYVYFYMFNTGNPRPMELRTSSPTFQHGLDVDPGKVLSSTLVQSGGFFPVLETSISPITAIATPTESICASHSMYSDMPKQEANNQTPPGTHAMNTCEKVHEHTPSLLYSLSHST